MMMMPGRPRGRPGLAGPILGALLLVASGCQTIHVLVPMPETVVHRERIPRSVGYHISPQTLGLRRHVQTSMPWFGFGVDTFIVEPGRIADEFAGAYLREAFVSFERLPDADLVTSEADFVIALEVTRFTLENRRAEFDLLVEVRDRGGTVVQTVVAAGESPSYGGRIGWALAGSFAFTLMGYYFIPVPTPPSNTMTAQIARAIYQSVNGEMHDAFAGIVEALREGSAGWGPAGGG